MTFEDGLKSLQLTFREYIKTQVLSKVKVDNLGKRTIRNYHYYIFLIEIFFVGLPPRKFPDFEKMTRHVLSGEILEAVGKVEALESTDMVEALEFGMVEALESIQSKTPDFE